MFEYRVIKKCDLIDYYMIYGVYTSEEGNIRYVKLVPPQGANMEGLREDLHLYMDALSKPILNEEDLPCTLD